MSLLSIFKRTAVLGATAAMAIIAVPTSASAGNVTALQAAINHQIAVYGGTQTSADTVSYGPDTAVVFGDASSPTTASGGANPDLAVHGCPGGDFETDYTCLYEYANFNSGHSDGRRLQFKDKGYWQDLNAYGFQNATSSWVNNRNNTAYLSTGNGGAGTELCLSANAVASSMGSYDNTANSIYLTSSTSC